MMMDMEMDASSPGDMPEQPEDMRADQRPSMEDMDEDMPADLADMKTDMPTDMPEDMKPMLRDPLQGEWSRDYSVPGVSGTIGAAIESVEAVSPAEIYAGGSFEAISGTSARNVAQWDGTQWLALGAGVDLDVNTLAYDATNAVLLAGGRASSGGFGGGSGNNAIMQWDGTSWTEFAPVQGAFPEVELIEVLDDGRVVVGGTFEGIDQSTSSHLAIYDGQGWSNWGSAPDGPVQAVVQDESGRYCIGGLFGKIGKAIANNIACWDASTNDWAPVGNGLPGAVNVVIPDGPNGELLAGGMFAFVNDTITGEPRAGIARWDGTEWTPFAGGLQDGAITQVRDLKRDPNGDLIVGGQFAVADKYGTNVTVDNLARWDGQTWSSLGGVFAEVGVFSVAKPGVYALAEGAAGRLIIGGFFSRADQTTALGIAEYDGMTWRALAPQGQEYQGLSGLLNDVAAAEDGTLYVGGEFSLAGDVATSNVAAWDGMSWSALGQGVDGVVFDVGVDPVSGDVIVGGEFTLFPPFDDVSNLARWNGTAWQAVGSASPDRQIKDILFASDGSLYVSGDFSTIGSTQALRVARWDGTQWSALGDGLGEPKTTRKTVTAIEEDAEGNLWATGIFDQTGAGDPAAHLAVWDGTSWAEGASGLDGRGADLLWRDETLWAVGSFRQAGDGTTLNSVGRWDGTAWQDVGGGFMRPDLAYTLTSIAAYGDGVFVSGVFNDNTGQPNHLAYWDGNAWVEVGDGLSDLAESLLVVGETLWVVGGFNEVGADIASFGIAEWTW